MGKQVVTRIKKQAGGARAGNSVPVDASAAAPDKERVSLWLYVAGLCVTLSGLFALNYSLDDSGFAALSYGVAIFGYGFSYTLRVRGIKLETIQAPLIVCVLLLALANFSGGGIGWLMPQVAANSRAYGLQLLVGWVALLHTFLLGSDSAILFACVPGMSLLALVSTLNPDTRVQNAFLVFIGAATFMMVHENFLRTQSVASLGGAPRRERRLITGQIQLTAACLVGALFLANIVAVPIRTVGQTLFDPISINAAKDALAKNQPPGVNTLLFSENNVVDLANGPTTESDAPVMRVVCDRALYWRGNTYSDYTGTRFENPFEQKQSVSGTRNLEQSQIANRQRFTDPNAPDTTSPQQVYVIPTSRYELSASEMRGSQKIRQHVELIGGVFNSFYGAAAIRTVMTSVPAISMSSAGALLGAINVPSNYDVESQVPAADPEILRAASSDLSDVPTDIQTTYMRLPDKSNEDTTRLKALVEQLTQGKSSNFEKVEALKAYIAAHCKYNLQSPRGPRDRDIVAWFLFDRQEGYCDSFAAALTVLCRYAKIPARMATGFLTGDYEGNNTYLVRQKYKHLWTEVFFPHIGWVPFDATEGTVDISNHSDAAKPRLSGFSTWLTSHGILPPLLAGVLLLMLGYVLKTEVAERIQPRRLRAAAQMRPQTNQQIVDAYARVTALLAKRGLARPLSETPDEYANNIARLTSSVLSSLAPDFVRLTELYTRFRYSRDIATPDDAQAAQSRASAIQNALQTVKPKNLGQEEQKRGDRL